MIAIFLPFSTFTAYSAITFDENRSFGRMRKIHGLFTRVRLGSLPPMNAGTLRRSDGGRCGLHLRAAQRTDHGGDLALTDQLGVGQHGARVGARVVFHDQLDLAPHDAAGGVDLVDRQLHAVQSQHAGLGLRAGQLVHQPEPNRIGCVARQTRARRPAPRAATALVIKFIFSSVCCCPAAQTSMRRRSGYSAPTRRAASVDGMRPRNL